MRETGHGADVLERLAYYSGVITGAGRTSVVVSDVGEDSAVLVASCELGGAGDGDGVASHSVALGGDDFTGVLEVTRSAGHPFEGYDRDLVSQLAEFVAAGLVHRKASRELKRRMHAEADALSVAMDARAGYSTAQTFEVDLAGAVARELEVDAATSIEVTLATLLRNCGLVGIPDHVAVKAGALDDRERSVVEQQPSWATEALMRVPGLEAVAIVVLHHRERWDGGGYPCGLSATRIPLASRIVGACSAFRAYTSDRPHRAAMAQAEALDLLDDCAGSQFDPDVAAALSEVAVRT
jgi:HD-GYP domain-containing protein (c-di-GMP phosphodiesterase class II)